MLIDDNMHAIYQKMYKEDVQDYQKIYKEFFDYMNENLIKDKDFHTNNKKEDLINFLASAENS